MRNNDATALATASAQEIERIWLYEIDVTGGALRLVQGRESVTYGGYTWTPAPITHGGLEENTSGKIDSLTIEIGNLNRDISALLELYNGLLGVKVRVIQVFDLTDADAYFDDIYFIDQPVIGGGSARFTLTTKYDLMDATIAPRLYGRTFCRWEYKNRGCWKVSGSSWAPSNVFVTGSPDTCNKTATDCRRHNNFRRFGGFPSVPINKELYIG